MCTHKPSKRWYPCTFLCYSNLDSRQKEFGETFFSAIKIRTLRTKHHHELHSVKRQKTTIEKGMEAAEVSIVFHRCAVCAFYPVARDDEKYIIFSWITKPSQLRTWIQYSIENNCNWIENCVTKTEIIAKNCQLFSCLCRFRHSWIQFETNEFETWANDVSQVTTIGFCFHPQFAIRLSTDRHPHYVISMASMYV